MILSVGFINPLVQIIPNDDEFMQCYPTPTVVFSLATLNTACRWCKRSAKKNIPSISKVVTFEATPKFWGMEEWIKRCNKSTRWTISKSFPVKVDVMARCSFSIDFCASSSSYCCIIVAKLPSLMIIYSFFSRLCISSSSSCCNAKAIWASLEIAALSSSGLDMAIAVYHSWGELIYHLFGTDFLRYIFDRQFQKIVLLMLQQCGEDCVVIGGRSTPFEILGCAIDLVYGAHWKC